MEHPNPKTRTQEALASLAEIQNVIDSSHFIEFPYQVLFAYGALILAMPAIELGTTYLTFGNPALIGNQWTVALRHAVVYGSIFLAVKFFVLRFTDAWKAGAAAHPLIRSAAGIQWIILVTGGVMMIVLGRAERIDLWIPILFPLTGVLFFVFGTFSKGPMKATAWFQVGLGLVYGLLLKEFSNERLWVTFFVLFGLSFLGCGAALFARRRKGGG
ncbi:MAG: hypothetical protein JST04_17290 [Bdellovibrionales bacterium]|nr:hypothetical protein [Bdellovibrionales bacterium]